MFYLIRYFMWELRCNRRSKIWTIYRVIRSTYQFDNFIIFNPYSICSEPKCQTVSLKYCVVVGVKEEPGSNKGISFVKADPAASDEDVKRKRRSRWGEKAVEAPITVAIPTALGAQPPTIPPPALNIQLPPTVAPTAASEYSC